MEYQIFISAAISACSSDTIYVKTGAEVSFNCVAYGPPETRVFWSLNGEPFMGNVLDPIVVMDKVGVTVTSKVFINSVDSADEGVYVCRHSTDNGVVEDKVFVDVYGKLQTILSSYNIQLPANSLCVYCIGVYIIMCPLMSMVIGEVSTH